MKKLVSGSLFSVAILFAACSSGSSTASSDSSTTSGSSTSSGDPCAAFSNNSDGTKWGFAGCQLSTAQEQWAKSGDGTVTQEQIDKLTGYLTSMETYSQNISASSSASAECKSSATAWTASVTAALAYWPTTVGKTWSTAEQSAPGTPDSATVGDISGC
ncbi:MAG: hypothetical protein F2903_09460 [Actinobacteria bacterium]|uniref:Unannotated protein n=1 Tax=freshwater metagenome TaxID=449393 RepID=A0A6J7A9U1_9ZZZZ|nr:hypothetical protein [Actinomycetota bacterium]MSX09882.1 hypothetical protein [Actinomycetota bacterium]MSX68299.1 hypothetical protein [Actinomycetota bacterium]